MALPPSAVRVEVLAARGLSHKGKSAFNAFVTMQLTNGGKKFATATVSHSTEPVWDEECRIPVTGMDADLQLVVQHRNKLGLEEFLGMLAIPLRQISSMSSWAQWMDLEGKGGNRDKRRGSLKTKINFIYDLNSPPSPSKPSGLKAENSPHGGGHRLSLKAAKSVVKGLSGALHHHHGHDRPPSSPKPSSHGPQQQQGAEAKQRKLSVDDVMQDLHLEDSMEQEAGDAGKVMPRSTTFDSAAVNKDDASEEHGSSWSRKSLKMRRRLSLPSVNPHGGSNRGSMASVAAIDETAEPSATGQDLQGSDLSMPAAGASPSTQSKHRRINSLAQTWLNRSRSSSDSTTTLTATEEEFIAQGNYAALSKQTLIRLVARQQDELGEKCEELANLRGYIDTVLMRVIEHNPELLVNLSSPQHSTAREQRDGGGGGGGGGGGYYSRAPVVQVSHATDSGCGSGSGSPERLGRDDLSQPTRCQRSSSSPVALASSHRRRPSLVSTSSDGKEVSPFSGSPAGRSAHHRRSESSSSSLVDSGSLSLLAPAATAANEQTSLQSARYRPT